MSELSFFKDKKVLITGHTGFKGSWLTVILGLAGARVFGYSLEPPTEPSMFKEANVGKYAEESIIADVRDYDTLYSVFQRVQPDIVIHMAAQPIVRLSYEIPRETYETNVMGTVNILEAVRKTDSVRSFLNVTTDKVYDNKEWVWGFRENERLDGFDPYSNSKSCSELVTAAYRRSFDMGCAVSTARAGNVIGGGDYAPDRIIPDCVRAACEGRRITVRNPYSVRPYQHVMEPLGAYLKIVRAQYEDKKLEGSYNVGPDDCDCVTTGALADCFVSHWGQGASWENVYTGGPHEAGFLKLDTSLIKRTFGWAPRTSVDSAVAMAAEWYKAAMGDEGAEACTVRQIKAFFEF